MLGKVDPRPTIRNIDIEIFRMVNLNVNPEKVFPIVECVNTFLCGLMTGIAVEQPSRMTMKDAVHD